MDIIQSSCLVPESSPFIKVVFDQHGKILGSDSHWEKDEINQLQKALPCNTNSIISLLFQNTNQQVNATSKSDNKVWQWSFHNENTRVFGYAIEISSAQNKQELLKQHAAKIDELRAHELAYYFRKLIHDFRSPLSGIISGGEIISSILSLDKSSDERLLLDEMGRGCKELYEKIGLDLEGDTFAKAKSTVCKSAVNLNDVLSESVLNNLPLSVYYFVNIKKALTTEVFSCYCDKNKLLIASNKMMRFLCQQYHNSNIEIFPAKQESVFQCVFQLNDKKIKSVHRNFIEHPSEISDVNGEYDLELLSEVFQLISINSGRLEMTKADIESDVGQEFNESFFFEFND